MDHDETWVWVDGTIYDPELGSYRDATADELRRNRPRENTTAAIRLLPEAIAAAAGALRSPEAMLPEVADVPDERAEIAVRLVVLTYLFGEHGAALAERPEERGGEYGEQPTNQETAAPTAKEQP